MPNEIAETSTETKPANPPVRLTATDWSEIAAALDIRLHHLQEQKKDDLLTKREREKWVNQLKRIGAIIGSDGKLAANQGVAPVQK